MTYQMDSPLLLLDDGGYRDPWLAPTFPPGLEEPRLENGERVIYAARQGHVTLQARGPGDGGWKEMWSPPKHASVVVTDRRTVVGCREFDRGSTWVGFGGVGLLAAAGATAVSRARARRASAGQCLALQWRHEWPSAVAYIATAPGWQGRLSGMAGVPAERIAVVAERPGARFRLLFGHVGDRFARNSATAVLAAIVDSRARGSAVLDPAERAAVRRLAANARLDGAPGESKAVSVPGAHAVGWRPAAAATTEADATEAETVADDPRACRDPGCDAVDLPTPLDRCDLCGTPTTVRVAAWTPAAVPMSVPAPRRADGPAACPNDSCDAYGLPTPLGACDLCGHSTTLTA